jgi:LPXTG-motif cell wall-anchored protein
VTAATLPDTGSDAAIPFGVALTLLLGGALVLTAARRRTATTRVD